MFSKELLELLEVPVVMAYAREILLAALPPARKECLRAVPFSNKCFAVLFRFPWWRRLRAIAVNVQGRGTPVFRGMVQRPGDFLFCIRTRLGVIRHSQSRGN